MIDNMKNKNLQQCLFSSAKRPINISVKSISHTQTTWLILLSHPEGHANIWLTSEGGQCRSTMEGTQIRFVQPKEMNPLRTVTFTVGVTSSKRYLLFTFFAIYDSILYLWVWRLIRWTYLRIGLFRICILNVYKFRKWRLFVSYKLTPQILFCHIN